MALVPIKVSSPISHAASISSHAQMTRQTLACVASAACATQVPLGQRFRQVLTDEEHFSPQVLVQHLKEAKGVQVRLK